MNQKRFPIPPFTEHSAKEKVQKAEDAWNTKNPILVSEAYTIDTEWRNRGLFIQGRANIVNFLMQKWETELDYKLKKELWCFTENKISVRLSMSGMTTTGNGLEAMAMKCGNLMVTA